MVLIIGLVFGVFVFCWGVRVMSWLLFRRMVFGFVCLCDLKLIMMFVREWLNLFG